jgi:hypothetical protein
MLAAIGMTANDSSIKKVTMLYSKLSTVVKAVRLRYAIPVVLLLAAVYLMVIYPWMTNWGSTAAEQQMALTGDELHPDPIGHATKAITINAPSDVVWQWLVQMGQDRAGFYTYTWLENLVGADIHNANEIRPEWQTLAVGDMWRVVPPDYLGNVGKDAGFRVLISEPGHALVLEIMGAFVLIPVDESMTRLLVRGEAAPANVMMRMVVEPVVFTMARPMLLGLKARAEGRPDAPVVLTAIAYLGWAAAGITVAYLFLSQRRRRYWIALPVVAALPALLMAGDIQAALAAFIAAGIPVLGFLVFGRSFWGSFLVIASVVLLTLLLAPEAATAIGLTFAVLLLAGLAVTVVGRSRTVDGAAQQLATPNESSG